MWKLCEKRVLLLSFQSYFFPISQDYQHNVEFGSSDRRNTCPIPDVKGILPLILYRYYLSDKKVSKAAESL